MEEPDPQTIAAARSGDESAFEQIVRRYQADVWRLCLHLLRDEALAEDVTQDAFVRAFRFLKRYRGESKFSTWLFSIARNCVIDELRRIERRRKLTWRLDQERTFDALDHTIALELRDALAALPIDLREATVLIDIFGMPYRDAARVLKVPEGTVKSRVHRGRETLASAFRPQLEVNDEV